MLGATVGSTEGTLGEEEDEEDSDCNCATGDAEAEVSVATFLLADFFFFLGKFAVVGEFVDGVCSSCFSIISTGKLGNPSSFDVAIVVDKGLTITSGLELGETSSIFCFFFELFLTRTLVGF